MRIKIPDALMLGAPRARVQLLDMLMDIRRTLVDGGRDILLDFTTVYRMESSATLLFASELRRAVSLAKSSARVRCIAPRDLRMQQVLKQIHLFELMRYRKKIVPTFKDVRHWRYATGHCVDGEKYESILGAFEGQVADALLDRLFRGLTEAMTNCHHHAYILPRQDGLSVQPSQKDWWMFSQEKDGYLTVVFCDLGVGIPNTLPVKRPALWKRIIGLGAIGDGEIIRQALEDSKTRTGKSYRGKGLKQLLEAAQMFQGSLRIYSNGGCYTYDQGRERVREYGSSILGTLIQWRVPVVESNLQL